jgi:hypothetical protein
MLQKVKGHTNLMRDKRTGAILNTDRAGIAQAKARKLARIQEAQRLDQLEKDVTDIKALLSQIAEKL